MAEGIKNITVVIGESGVRHDRQIKPGATPREVLNDLNLDNATEYVLSAARGQEPFGADENIYPLVQDGAKLYASTPADVGVGASPPLRGISILKKIFKVVGILFKVLWQVLCFFGKCISGMIEFFSGSGIQSLPSFLDGRSVNNTPKNSRVRIVSTGSAHRRRQNALVTQAPKQRVSGKLVQSDQRPYWVERGWSRRNGHYTGYFRTRYGSWKGKAKVYPGGDMKLFIHEPPKVLHRHPHWVCFFQQPKDWYDIHIRGSARERDLSGAIMSVEQILTEAYAL